MLKELLLTIVLGALLGFGVTGGYYTLKKNPPKTYLPSVPTPSIPVNLTNKITPSPIEADNPTGTINNHVLSIDSPENESIVANSKVTVKGTTTPKSYIIIDTFKNSYTTTADNSGGFSLEIEIDSGANIISVTSVDNDDYSLTNEILVTYSTAVF